MPGINHQTIKHTNTSQPITKIQNNKFKRTNVKQKVKQQNACKTNAKQTFKADNQTKHKT